MNRITNVLIVGLGLIGGSLALCIKKEYPDITIVGFNRSLVNANKAKESGVIDQVAENFQVAAEAADVIIFCTPVRITENLFQQLGDCQLKPNIILTDAGSTKGEIMEKATPLLAQNLTFIGGHPMAGSHKSGISAADVNLFENAYYLLTPASDKQHVSLTIIQELLKGTRSKFLILSPEEHDQVTGILSHLPHVIAAGIVNQTKSFIETYPNVKRLAAGGFRDITRIASSDPSMWTDILLSNRHVLLNLLNLWQTEMSQVATYLLSEDREAIFTYFTEAKETRDTLPIHKEGAIPAFYDLFVDIPDYPGIIAEITTYLAKENISLINLRILEMREDISGILQLTFKNEKELEKAKECIAKHTVYSCFEK